MMHPISIPFHRIPVAFLALLLTAGCGDEKTSSDTTPHDSGMKENDAQTGGQGGSAGTAAEGGAGGSDCSLQDKEAQTQSARNALREQVPCFSGSFAIDKNGGIHLSFFLSTDFNGPRALLCHTDSNVSVSKAHEQAASKALEGLDLSCLKGLYGIDIAGGACEQRDTLEELLAACPPWWEHVNEELGIVFDENGQAVSLKPAEGKPSEPEIETCVLDALAGKTFPCLANLEVCAGNPIP
ncbi:MAG TPA: hypothetical protein PKL73_24335 [Polyangiaceae bacterium]|nr:hypothetical protein [Polyangiaceae bacterium]